MVTVGTAKIPDKAAESWKQLFCWRMNRNSINGNNDHQQQVTGSINKEATTEKGVLPY